MLPDSCSLQSCICSAVAMYQIMFSLVLLNWSLHVAPMTPLKILEGAKLTLDGWVKVNEGIRRNGGNLPTHFLESLFHGVERKIIPHLGIELPDLISSLPNTECDTFDEPREDG